MAWHVCPDCRGEGTKDTFGAFTREDLDEWYGDSPEREEFLTDYMAGRIGREVCGYCDGRRVVDDEKAEIWDEVLLYRQEVEAEQRMGA